MTADRSRVLYWADLFWPYVGGPEVLAATLIPFLRDRGFELLVVTSHDHLPLPDEDCFHGVPVHRHPLRRALAERDPTAIRRLRARLREQIEEFAPDLMHLNSVGPTAWYGLAAARERGMPYVVTLHTEVLPSQAGGGGSLLRDALRGAGWITAVSARVLSQARTVDPGIAGRCSVIRNFFELPTRPPAPLAFDPPVLLGIGRLIPAKGFDLAVAAMPAVLDAHPDTRLVLAGDGPERARLQARARDLGIADRVEFPGWIPPHAVLERIERATLVVLPSRREGLPLVAVQAAGMARPMVAADVGGLAEVVRDGRTGIVVSQDDPRAIADAVRFLLDRPAMAQAMGDRARRRALRLFDPTRCMERYAEVYERTAAEPAGSRPGT